MHTFPANGIPQNNGKRFLLLSKIETNVIDKFETRPFTVGGYNWILHVYLNGNTKDGGAGYVSLYVEIDKSGFDSAHQEVYADLRFYIFNRKERKYFTIQDTDVWRFNAFNTMWGFSQVLPVDTFKDPKNGYLYDGEHCEFGVDVTVPTPFEESETFSISSSSDKFTWRIENFSTLVKDAYSSVFSLGGKKWNLRMVPTGSGSGSGKYVSLFLQLSTNQRRAYEYIYVRVKLRRINIFSKREVRERILSSLSSRNKLSLVDFFVFFAPVTGGASLAVGRHLHPLVPLNLFSWC
ncbi:TRAF-like family protein [Raphanus sativus]|nr:TRAF-like family protein [Raphanus sativus]